MLWTREQLALHFDRNNEPRAGVLIKRGSKYMGREIPDGYFTIQDFCVSQGIATKADIPDLTHILQGVEYIFYIATGEHPEDLTPRELIGAMYCLNREKEFEGGALRQYPELLEITKTEILKLPRGREVIEILGGIPEYQELFT